MTNEHGISIRAAEDGDRRPLAELFAAVAEERDGIASEPPVDIDERAASWALDGMFVAVAGAEIVGSIHVAASRLGVGEIGMAVARDWRGRGVGSALLAGAIEWARRQGLHKLSLSVFAHNDCRDRALPQVRVRRRGPARQALPAVER